MKRLHSHFIYPLFILIYYSFCILDSALSDSDHLNNQGVTHNNQADNLRVNEKANNEADSHQASVKVPTREEGVQKLEGSEGGSSNESEDERVKDVTADPSINIIPQPITEKPPFTEISSNKISNGIINDTPIILSLEDTATKDLQEKATIQHAKIVTQSQTPLDGEKSQSLGDSNITKDDMATDGSEKNKVASELNIDAASGEGSDLNGTQEKAITEEIPSFSEWAQKHLEEAEKREPANISTHQPQNQTKLGSGAKLRWKNYASVDCGAKVVNANPEAQNTWAILSPSRDEYKLNPCNSRVWFIVELCEAIQVKKIDLANYELFSSSPKEFVVSVSDRYPTRDWVIVGQFTAKDERDIQSFDLNHENFGKYVKIEIKSHYGSEHYCPLSLFMAYGTSVFEVLQKEDPSHMQQNEDDDDDDILEPNEQKAQTGGNLLSSATDAVISMVKKAASVLGNKSNQSDLNNFENKSNRSIMMQTCNSPSHYVVCNNCTDFLFGKIYELLSCRPLEVVKLLKLPFITKAMVNSKICKKFGFDFRNKTADVSLKSCPKCVETFFSEEYIGAMCNILAITFNKVLRNVSFQYANSTNFKDEKLVDINNIAPKNLSNPTLDEKIVIVPTKTLDLDSNVKIKPSEVSLDSNVQHFNNLERKNDANTNIEPSIVELPVKKEVDDKKVVEVDELLPKILKVPEILESLPNIEVVKDNFEAVVEENLEHLLSDAHNTETATNGEPSVIPSLPSNNVNLQAQKESVFLRLSNRIKALERNMSLSSQYLEELSKRYKKQVEEMQRNLDKTVKILDETDSRHAEYNKKMEERLEYLTNAIDNVLFERDVWRILGSMFSVVLITFLLFTFCGRRNKDFISKTNSPKTSHLSSVKRSSQPVKIIVSSPCKREKSLPKVRKKKKGLAVQIDPKLATKKETIKDFSPRSTSTMIWHEDQEDWVEERKVIEDIPFVLDEGDNSILEILPDPKVALKIPLTKIPQQQLVNPNDLLTVYGDKIQVEQTTDQRLSPRPTPKLNGNGAVSNGNLGTGDSNINTPKSSKKGFKKLFKRVLSKD